MVKNLFMYIFIYILLVGCDTQSIEQIMTNDVGCESNCYLRLEAPNLQIDKNGYYHIEWLEGYSQTFTTLDAKTGTDSYHKVGWDSYSGIMYQGKFITCVNKSSYTNQTDGIAHTVLSVWESMVGDTITIYAEYTDWCDIQYIQNLKVVIDNEIQN